METKKTNSGFWIGILFSIGCLVAIFIFINPAEIWGSLKTVRIPFLLWMAVGLVAFLALRAVRWRFMLENKVSFREVHHIQNIGYMLNMVLPFRIGDVGRAVLIGNVPPATLSSGISTMVVERMLDMLFMVTLLPFTLATVTSLPTWMREGARGFGFVSIGGILILIVAANKRPFTTNILTHILNRLTFLDTAAWLKRVEELLDGLNSLTRWKDGFILIILSIVVWIPILFAYATGIRAVGLDLPLAHVGFVVCAAAFSVALPSSPGQIGVFHAGVIGALQVLDQPEAASASFAIVYHTINLVMMILMGLIGLSGIKTSFRNVVQVARSKGQGARGK